MAWTLSAFKDRPQGTFAVVSEEAGGGGSNVKTLIWGTDLASSLGALAGDAVEVLGVRAELTTGTASTERRVKIQALDASDDVLKEAEPSSGFSTASSLRVFEFNPNTALVGSATELVGVGSLMRCHMPAFFLVPGMKLKVLDALNADATDSFVVHVFLRAAK